MLLILVVVALVNVILLAVSCCLIYFLMKKRLQSQHWCSVDTEKSPDNEVDSSVPLLPATSLAHSSQSMGR